MIGAQVLKHLPETRKGKRGKNKGDVRRGATVKGVIEKGRRVGVIEGMEVRRDEPI